MKMENSGHELDVSPKQDLFVVSLYYVEIRNTLQPSASLFQAQVHHLAHFQSYLVSIRH